MSHSILAGFAASPPDNPALMVEGPAFLNADGPILDVRSPSEYALGHIPGATSFPLFSDVERAEIGTLYKKQGRDTAIQRGLVLVEPKLDQFVEQASALSKQGTLRVHCWRGGMRSGAMAWLLDEAGLPVMVLKGGYKAYRRMAWEAFASLESLVVLDGPTGSGKTALLHALKAQGEQILDLEALACHRGSAFGALGMPEQPSTQQFQNDLYKMLRPLDFKQRIWVEGESKSIGRCYMPDPFWDAMNRASLISIRVPMADRVARLVQEYGRFSREALAASLQKLERRLGGLRMKSAQQHLAEGNLAAVAADLLAYYDDAYEHHQSTYREREPLLVSLPSAELVQQARLLRQQADAHWPTFKPRT